jgi:DNA-binding NtrC family response regulator
MHRLLIVDDEESICFAMGEYFRMQGYEVDCAQAVEAAEALLDKGCYSVVIADLRLAGIFNMGGLEVIKTVHKRCPGTRIIVLTAYGSPEMETETRKNGVDAFLHKPQPLPEVAQIVYGLVGSGA